MDQSHLDKKYFIDCSKYNCPFCNRHSVTYEVIDNGGFDWSEDRKVYYYLVRCGGCSKESFHLSNNCFEISYRKFYAISVKTDQGKKLVEFDASKLDELFFYHQPTSHFTIDSRIPAVIRDMVYEAVGCAEMNFMVGASGALRKAIYEFLKAEKVEGESYEARIKALKVKHSSVPKEYFDALANIQGMTSEELHEQEGSWEPWEKPEFDFLVGAVKSALMEVYVIPDERRVNLAELLEIKKKMKKE